MASDWVEVSDDEILKTWRTLNLPQETMIHFAGGAMWMAAQLRKKNAGKPVGINGLTHEEESSTASVMGLVRKPAAADKAGGNEPVAWGVFYKYAPDCVQLVSVRWPEERVRQYVASANGRSNMTIAPLYTRPQPQEKK